MNEIHFLYDLVIILVAAVVVIFVCTKARIPPVVGFLLTGLIIGPYGLRLIERTDEVEVYAEIGVVMLLFMIGLEFSLDRLKQIGRPLLIGGSLQAGLTLAAAFSVALLFAESILQAGYIAALVMLSSTVIVLKLFSQRGELEAPQGKIVIGILLFQDILAVMMIMLVPVVASDGVSSASALLIRFVLGIVVMGAVFMAARYLMPPVLYGIARLRVREVFVLGSLAICLGLALMTEALGFSLALGAFLAGLLVSESEYSNQVVAEVSPFRDVFNSLFFISIGMLLNVGFAVSNLHVVLLTGLAILVLKAAIIFPVVLLMRFPVRVAIIVSVSLAQVGEFSFVLFKVGQDFGLLAENLYQIFLSASVFTMMITPLMIKSSPRIDAFVQEHFPRMKRDGGVPEALPEEFRDHVVVVGYGLGGKYLSRVLRETGIPYIVVDINGETVRKALREGEPIIFGDTTRPDILEGCHVTTARILVFLISDPVAVRRGIRLARQMNPGVQIIVRTDTVAEIDEIHRLGADQVVPEELEASIEIFVRVLEHYRVARNVINAQEKLLRGERYTVLRSKTRVPEVSDKLLNWLSAGTTEVFLVQQNTMAAHRTIRELDLRKNTGVTIIAVVRGEKPNTNPSPDYRVLPGDSLVLVGTHADLEKAFQLMDSRT